MFAAPPNLSTASIRFATAGAAEKFDSMLKMAFKDNSPLLSHDGRKLRIDMDEDLEIRLRKKAMNCVRDMLSEFYNKGRLPNAVLAKNFVGLTATWAEEYATVKIRIEEPGRPMLLLPVAKNIEGFPVLRFELIEEALVMAGEKPGCARELERHS